MRSASKSLVRLDMNSTWFTIAVAFETPFEIDNVLPLSNSTVPVPVAQPYVNLIDIENQMLFIASDEVRIAILA